MKRILAILLLILVTISILGCGGGGGSTPSGNSPYTTVNITIDLTKLTGSSSPNVTQVGVYNADTMALIRTVPIKSPISAIALNSSKSAALVGTTAGYVFSMDLTSGGLTQINGTTAGFSITGIAPLDPTDIFIEGTNNGGYLATINSGKVDTTNEKTIISAYTNTNCLAYSAYDNSVYLYDYLYVASARLTTNYTISELHESSIYTNGNILRLFNGGKYLATSDGNWFPCDPNDSNDLKTSAPLPYTFTDLAADDALSKIYLLNGSLYPNPTATLYVLEQSNFLQDYSSNSISAPLSVAFSQNNVIIFTYLSQSTDTGNVNTYYAQIIPKANFSAKFRGRQPLFRKRA